MKKFKSYKNILVIETQEPIKQKNTVHKMG